jgi:methyl-accepting chemotaxis protein
MLLDQATQVNANSATIISNLQQKFQNYQIISSKLQIELNLNKLNQRRIEDIDLVFKVSKLKNDHIKFKIVNFEKIGKQKLLGVLQNQLIVI